MEYRAAIIGGGITGLATAYYLQQRAPTAGYVLLESSPRWGGKIVTDVLDGGYVVEGGPDSFVTDKPWGLDLCHEVGLGDALIPCNNRLRKIYMLYRGRLMELPSGFRLTIPTEFGPFVRTSLISPWGKLRMAMDFFLPPRKHDRDESVGEFIGRRMGREAVEKFAGPLMGGIYVSDPDRMSIKGTFPRFHDMELKHGSLIRAALRGKKHPMPHHPKAAGRAMFNALRPGMAELPARLTQRLTGEMRTGTAAIGLLKKGAQWEVITSDGRKLLAQAVVLALPAHQAARLIRPTDEKLADQLDRIRYVSTSVVSLAYRAADMPPALKLDGYGALIPPAEGRDVVAVTWSSVKFEHRAPADGVLMRAFLGGYHDEEKAGWPEDVSVERVRAEFARLFGIAATPLFHRFYRWTKGNPQYDVGHLDRVAEMEQRAAQLGGLHLAGSAYRGIGMPDCIHSGLQAAQRIGSAGVA